MAVETETLARSGGEVAMPELVFLEELKSYVGFTEEHARRLSLLREPLTPAFPGIIDEFYAAIQRTPRAMAVFTGGLAQIERQKNLLLAWLEGLFTGEYGEAYFQLRARIGRTHVRIRLDQRYMFTAMNVVRQGLHRALDATDLPPDAKRHAHDALDKICDIELAIMLQTYSEDSATRLRDSERMAALGQLSGFIGHELRNPLAVMETSLHLLKKRLPVDDESVGRHVRRLSEQLTISSEIIAALLELARDRPIQRDALALAPAIESILGTLPAIETVSVSVSVPGDLPMAKLDEKQARHLIGNLVVNAIQALGQLPDDAPRSIAISAQQIDDVLLLTVDDSGPGIPHALRERLFEPLTTGNPKGLGLGLALCRRIAEKHGGEIRARPSLSLGGARFEVTLPESFEPAR